ncbi:SURF1 family protein [Hansschlegelia zhihuaiae]|uniref:SURF1-like protein n=1 Tax=Hansschlegelia zhihuaiae TaxID=405005 RepID=A0A4V1KJ21_9HYPH|nr:SURF1 family protein [Hansschlegelia zhihuaiae]RXF72672.1 SURF1 family protein [Hansschlegelia zhihuaiae]
MTHAGAAAFEAGEAEPAFRPRSPAALLAIALATIVAFSGFCALGVWQVERRAWKLDLIGRVEARVHSAPTAAPAPADWPRVNAADDEYRRVRIEGVFERGKDTLVQATTELGAGYWVLSPLRTTDGFSVLVNRGFIPADRKDPASRAAGEPSGETTVVGLLRMTEPKGGFLRANDPAADLWRSRDVAAISAARGLTDAAPYFIDADAAPNPGGLPVGGLTVVAFRNQHLVYALTWFALAALVAGAAAIVARHEFRARR